MRKADILIPVYRDPDVTERCIESVFACSGEALGQVIVINDCSPDEAMAPRLEALARAHPALVLHTHAQNLGFVGTVNRGLFLRQRDVVLLNSDTRVTPGWLTEMLEVAYSDERLACVSPLSNNATICSVPTFGEETRADEVPEGSLGIASLPRSTLIPTGVGFCMLLKDAILRMIGPLDPVYGRGYFEEIDWAMRARALGFLSARANRAFVYHLGSVSFGADRTGLNARNKQTLSQRYPLFFPEMQSFYRAPEARVASHAVSRRVRGLHACVDLRHLPEKPDGTWGHGMQLVRGLQTQPGLSVAACVSFPSVAAELSKDGIPVVEAGMLDAYQILHRPAQPRSPHLLAHALSAAPHSVVGSPDLCSYRTPLNFSSLEKYEEYRALSFVAVQSAQAVIALSEHNRAELLREFGLPPERVHTVPLGVDADRFGQRNPEENRRRLAGHGIASRFFLYAGSDAPHKNLRLLLAAYARYREAHAQAGDVPELLLCGGPSYSSGGLYHLPAETWLVPGARYLGTVEAEDVRALMQEALAFVSPSTSDAFGRSILEAMAAGTPVICSSLAAVPEVAGDAALYLQDCTQEELSRLLSEVASSPETRARLSAAGRERARQFTWAETARRTAQVYEAVISRPDPQSLFQRQMLSTLLRSRVSEAFVPWRLPGT